MDLTSALKRKIALSVGLVDSNVPQIVSDFKRLNAVAEARRDIDEFERKLQDDVVGASDSDEEEVDMASAAVVADLKWSDQAEELDRLAKNKKTRQYGRLEVIQPYLQNLRLNDCGLTSLDKDLPLLCNLKELNVCGNEIEVIKNLPANLISLQAYDNKISRIDIAKCVCASNLVHMGLGYNQITSLMPWTDNLCTIQSLDLSFNNISNLEETIDCLREIECLHTIRLTGNPICILPNYRQRVLAALRPLQVLDGIAVSDEQIAAGEYEENKLNIVTLDVQVHAVKVQRTKKEETDEPTIKDDEEPAEEDRRITKYLLYVVIYLPNVEQSNFRTERVALEDSNGVEEKEGEESNKIEHVVDMVFKMDRGLIPTERLRDDIEDGLQLELFLVEQLLAPKEREEAETEEAEQQEVEYVLLNETEHLLSTGCLNIENVLKPESWGRLDIKETSVALSHPLKPVRDVVRFPHTLDIPEVTELPFELTRDSSLVLSVKINPVKNIANEEELVEDCEATKLEEAKTSKKKNAKKKK